jgi:hypothetical protein
MGSETLMLCMTVLARNGFSYSMMLARPFIVPAWGYNLTPLIQVSACPGSVRKHSESVPNMD